jgi:hypothetical protein
MRNGRSAKHRGESERRQKRTLESPHWRGLLTDRGVDDFCLERQVAKYSGETDLRTERTIANSTRNSPLVGDFFTSVGESALRTKRTIADYPRFPQKEGFAL